MMKPNINRKVNGMNGMFPKRKKYRRHKAMVEKILWTVVSFINALKDDVEIPTWPLVRTMERINMIKAKMVIIEPNKTGTTPGAE
jgi:hypothetical protein